MSKTYEVNANDRRSYSSTSATKVASVAAEWAKQGHEPHAYAIFHGEEHGVRTERVDVGTAKQTAKALAAAR